MTRVDYLRKDVRFRLAVALKIVWDAYPESYGVYMVGSVLERPDYRDVDLRCILGDDDFDRYFPGVHGSTKHWHPHFTLACLSISAFLQDATGLPIDFQFQRMTEANEKYKGKTRNPIGEVLVSAPDAA